jgi:hypothetical protein
MAGDRLERATFAKLIFDGALEIGDGYRAKNKELGGDGLVFLRAGHVTDTHIDFDGVERFHAELEPRVRSKLAKPLEAIARALFKSWFIDFDPVRRNADRGRNQHSPRPTSHLSPNGRGDRDEGVLAGEAYDHLFSDSFEDSELGEIPKGWKVKTLGDMLDLAYGKALKAEDRHDGNVPVFGSNGQVGWHDERIVAGPGIIVGRKGNPGVTTWVPSGFFAIDTTFYVVSMAKKPQPPLSLSRTAIP